LATKQVFSARGGLNRLVDALANAVGKEYIILSASDIQICPNGNGWSLDYRVSGEPVTTNAGQVITTCGAYSLPGLLPFVNPAVLQQVNNLQYAPIVQAAVGIRNTGKLTFNAFGGLVPSREGKEVLGILFPSACFDHRAPEGGALFSFFIGGVKHTGQVQLPDQQIEELVIRNFHAMLKFPAACEPDLIRIFRHHRAIPQYHSNSGIRFDAINALERQYPGLFIGGNLKEGIGMADRIRQGVALSDRAGCFSR
jgi:oxygen-dependent protoporphyrinogen oxidase